MRGAADRKGRGRKWIVVAGALLCGVLIAASILWYFTAYRPYDRYAEALKTLPGWQESEVSRESGSDEAGYSFTVKRPGFLHWTGNLALSAPNIRLENGEEIWFTDALIIWPLSGGGTEQGVILCEYGLRRDGADCVSRQLYITPEGDYIPWGDEAEDLANEALLAEHRDTVETLLDRARTLWDLP